MSNAPAIASRQFDPARPTDHTYLPADYSEADGKCPAHPASRTRKIYTFGKFGDAEVVTFSGCKCAVCINAASLQCGPALGHEYTYHSNYSNAAGRAKLIKMQEQVANAPFA